MNKRAMAVLTLGFAMCMSAAFAGCGETEGDGKEPTSEEVENTVSEQLSAEEWDAAFSAENFKNCKMVMLGEYAHSDYNVLYRVSVTEVNGVGFVKFEDGMDSGSGMVEVVVEEGYYQKTEGETFFYLKNSNGDWEKSNSSHSYTASYQLGKMVESVLQPCVGKFDNYEFNAEEKGFVAKVGDSSNMIPEGAVVKFKDKKLFSIEYSTEDSDEGCISYVFTYGHSVTLPKIEDAE